ncbi:fibronectin type III domain-containing protein [Paenibacillus silvisoli]|uniref:fibronectin type III domain-containing protein n=1 Tax=Paenibacillus silvisoli TaxID=3110539 RepID=UPI002805ED6B|nr:fibronectin type III domain-containing protein [Paenibacillus silvisoli]
MGRKAFMLGLITALVSGLFAVSPSQQASAAGSTYYVDAVNGNDTTGSGSTGSPWKTISKAAGIAIAGDTVKIRSGTYRETVKPANSGTAGNPITFMPDNGATVTVSGADRITSAWSVHSGSIYKTSASLNMGDFLDSVYVDGVANFLARSPNTDITNLYDPNLYLAKYPETNRGVLVDPVNLTQANGYWDNAALFIADSGAWNFSSALGTTYTQGNLNLKTSQSAYSLKLSSYDNTLKLLGANGSVLGSSNVTVQTNTTYNLKVTASGSSLNVYLNNGATPVITATDSALKEGSFGVGVESSSGTTAATATFTNVNAAITSQNPNQPTGRYTPNFSSNIKGWAKDESAGYWTANGTTLSGYTQPQTSSGSSWYNSNTTAKDFTYSADVKLTSAGGSIYLQFRKEEPPGSVIDLADWGLGTPEYYIMGKLAALDYPGEWYYDKTTGTLYLRTTASDTPANHTVEVKARNLAFDLTSKSYITVSGINLFAATIDMTDGSNDVIDGIHAKYLSEFNKGVTYSAGICLCGANSTVKNSELQYSSGALVTISGSNNKLVNNLIHDGTYGPIVFNSAVEILGMNHLISHNEVYHSGRSLIGGEFYGSVIQYNDFHDGNYFATDTGLLYTAHNGLGNSEIHHNYWHGSGYRYNGPNGTRGDWVGGVYLDEHSTDALIYKNVTWSLPWHSIVVNHFSDHVQIYNNTTYNASDIYVSFPTYGIDAYKDRIVNNIATDTLDTGASAIGAYFGNNLTTGNPNYVNTSANDFRLQTWATASNALDYQSDNHFSATTGAYYQVRFNGTQIKLYSEKDTLMGIVGVSIDGGTETMVDTYSTTHTGNTLVYTSPTLSAGQHTMKVRVTGTKNANSSYTWHVADRVDIINGSTTTTVNDSVVGSGNNQFEFVGGSDAINVGTPIRGITDGYVGSAPDVGAYESGGADWTAGVNFASPPNPTYQLIDTDFKNLVVNGRLDLNRMRQPNIDSLYGWTKTNSQTAQPAFDYSGQKISSRWQWETGISLGTGADGIEQTITGLQPNTTYAVRGFLRAGASGQSVRLGVKNYGGADSYQETTATTWEEKNFTFTTGAANTGVTIYGYKPTTGGYAFVDDISVTATTAVSGGSDTTAPSAPTGLSASSVTDTTATLTWTASTDNVGVTGYKVYRNGTEVGTAAGTSYTDSGLTASTTYTYTVKAADAAGNLSAASSSAQATTTAGSGSGYSENFNSTTIGQVPSGWTVSASGASASVQQAADGANTTNRALALTQTSYGSGGATATKTFTAQTGTVTVDTRMKASQTNALISGPMLLNGSGTPIVQIAFRDNGKIGYVNSSIAWTDTTVSYAANQWYDVHIVVNLAAGTFNLSINGTSVLTNAAVMASSGSISQIQFATNMWYPGTAHFDNIQVGTGSGGGGDTQAPTAPTGVSVASVTDTTAALTWTASTDNVGVTGYKVYRNGTEVGSPTGTSYTDSGLTANTSYTYTVKATDAASNLSAASSSVQAKTSLYAESFDGTTIGQMPSGWTVSASGASASVQQAADGANTTNRAMAITQTAYGSGGATATKTFTAATGTVTVDTRMMASQTNALITGPILLNGSGTAIVQVAFRDNGKFGYVNSSIAWTDTSMSYAANQWYDVRIVVNLAAGTFNLSINGTAVLTNAPVMASASSVSQVQYGTNMWYPGTAYFDKIQVSQA